MNKWFMLYRDAAGDGGSGTAVAEPPVDTAPASVTMITPAPAAGSGIAPATFAVPDAYRDKPWAKDLDSTDKVFAKLAGAQELIGKRAVPAPDAPPEEWNKFYDSIGRPKTPGEYVIEGADKADPKFLPRVQGAFHKAGLTPAQAKIVYADVNAALQEIATEKGVADAKQNTDFDALGVKVFGAERDAILATSKDLIDKHCPAEMKSHVASLSNEQLVVMAGVLNNIHKTYIKEDRAPGAPPVGTGLTPADISSQARLLIASKAYTDPFDPQHSETVRKVDALYGQLRKK